MERKKLVRSILGQVLGIGIGSWVGTVLGVTLANWQRGELSAAGFGWTVLGCGIGSLLVSAVFFRSQAGGTEKKGPGGRFIKIGRERDEAYWNNTAGNAAVGAEKVPGR